MTLVKVKWNKSVFTDVGVDLKESVLSLKAKIGLLTHIPVEKQKLLYKGRILKNENTLESSGIEAEAVLLVIGAPEIQEERKEVIEPVLSTDEKKPDSPGLANLGNTSFLNVSIQILRKVPELMEALEVAKGKVVAQAFYEVIENMNRSKKAYAPIPLVARIHTDFPLFAKRDSAGKLIELDVGNFLEVFIPAISAPLPVISADGSESSVFRTLFQLEFETKITSLEDEGESEAIQRDTGIKLLCLLETEETAVDRMEDGLRLGLENVIEKRNEALDRTMRYRTEKRVSRLPPYLLVQYSRFSGKSVSSAPDQKSKILRKVDFPLELDLAPFCTSNLQQILTEKRTLEPSQREGSDLDDGKYTLIGVISHQGQTIDSGHFIAWVRETSGDWLQCDDDSVTFASPTKVQDLGGGNDGPSVYLLLYGRPT